MTTIFDNGIVDGILPSIITALAGTWDATESDVILGNITVGFRYNVSTIAGYPYDAPNGAAMWLTTMAIIAYTDGTSANKVFTEELALDKQAKMVILIARNI